MHCTTHRHSTWDPELKSRLARRTRFNPTHLHAGGRASVTSRPRRCSCSACGQPSSSSCSCGWTSASWSGSWTSSEWGTICFLPSFWFLEFASFCAVRSKFCPICLEICLWWRNIPSFVCGLPEWRNFFPFFSYLWGWPEQWKVFKSVFRVCLQRWSVSTC